jgi:hypothetical protein
MIRKLKIMFRQNLSRVLEFFGSHLGFVRRIFWRFEATLYILATRQCDQIVWEKSPKIL